MCPSGRHHNGLYAHRWGQACDRRVCTVPYRVSFSLISTSLPSGRLTALTGPIMKLSNVGLFTHSHAHSHVHTHTPTQKHACAHTEPHKQEHTQEHMHNHTHTNRHSLGESATHTHKPNSGAYRETWSSRTSCVQNLENHRMQITEEKAATGL